MLALLFLSAFAASFVTAAPEQISEPPTLVRFSGNDTSSTEFVSAVWVSGWAINDTSNIKWQDYSHAKWCFAVTTPDGNLSLADSGPSYISNFVTQAKAHNVLASVSIGGWTGSQYFSSAVTPANRSNFVDAVLAMVSQYNLDGCDFDWEYPGGKGIGCNEGSSSDSENFLAFLQELRTKAGNNLYLTAAVSPTPFADSNGQPMTDVSGFAEVLDNIAIMNYDINGQWSNNVGPNAPLNSCSTPSPGSATDAVKAWTNAKFPANKIVLGVPSYGHTFNVASSSAVDGSGNLALNASFTKNPPTDQTDQCGQPILAVDTVTFADMIAKGLLKADGTPASGMKSQFDNCSQTPFLYDQTNQTMYSYDDPQSFAEKGRFIVQNNLLGFSMWDLAGDSNGMLVESLATAAGVTDC